MIQVSTDIDSFSNEQIVHLYISANYGLADVADTKMRLFPNNVRGIFAVKDKQLVGILRYFTDDFTAVWIAEAVTCPSDFESEILDVLLESVIALETNRTIYSEIFHEQIPTFQKHGIEPKPRLQAVARRATEI